MPQGLQIFNGSGQLTLEITDSLTKHLGQLDTPVIPVAYSNASTVNGSILDSRLADGKLWSYCTSGPSHCGYGHLPADVWQEGQTLRWSIPAERIRVYSYMVAYGYQPLIFQTRIVYGVF